MPIFNKEFKPFLHNHFQKWKKYSSRVEAMFEQNRIEPNMIQTLFGIHFNIVEKLIVTILIFDKNKSV